ncbi:MAG: LacI family DNA-binding transcriptional regulator [Planctomycetota bacterium]
MPVSMLDIAKYAGVSRPVVSKVLNGGKTNIRISNQTRERILAAAKELGYRPNLLAHAVSQGKTHAAGYVCYELDGVYTTAGSSLVLSAASRVLAEHGRHLVFSTISESQLRDNELPAVFTSVLVDVLVLDGTGVLPQEVIEMAQQHELPCITVNVRQQFDAAYPDDFNGAREATEVLLDLGHRSIGYAGVYNDQDQVQHYSVHDRRAGYEQAMLDRGLPPRVIMRNHHKGASGDHQALRAAMSGDDAVTAWVAYEESTAIDVYLTAQAMGLSIPKDISIIAMHRGGDRARLGHMTCTSMLLGEPRLGTAVGGMILKKMADPRVTLPSEEVDFLYHAGTTLAPPRD